MFPVKRLVAIVALFFALPAFSASNYLENKLLDFLVRGQSYSAPATVYVGLSTTACSDGSNGTEVSGGSYARVAVSSSLANWSGTQSAGSTSASSGTGGDITNNNVITFPTATASWGTVTYWFLSDASTSGNQLMCVPITSSLTVGIGQTIRFPPGTLHLTMQ